MNDRAGKKSKEGGIISLRGSNEFRFGKWKKFRIVVSFQGIGYRWEHVETLETRLQKMPG